MIKEGIWLRKIAIYLFIIVFFEKKMNKVLCISILLLFTIPVYSSIDITCPADVTIHLFDLDLDYESYGDPTVDSQSSYVLDMNIDITQENCVDTSHTIIIYTATNQNGDSESCEQILNIVKPELDEIEFPENVVFDGVSLEQAQKDPSTFPKQFELIGYANWLATHDEQISFPLGSSEDLIISRRWTVLDWCTAQTISDSFEIRIINYIKDPSTPLFTLDACNGKAIDVFNIEVFTDQANYQLKLDSCNLFDADIAGFLNCIAEHNGISPDNHFIIELEGPDDYLNGLSTLDMLLTQRHILAIKPFTSECEFLSADTNNNGSVTVSDLLLMRKLILGIIVEYPDSPSWKILNSTILDDNTDPDEQDLKFRKDEFPLTELELIAVKTGDVTEAAK